MILQLLLNRLQKEMQRLCVGCGLCISLCPATAISMVEIRGRITVSFDDVLCCGCSACVKSCPAIFNVFGHLSKSIGRLKALGNVNAVLFCHATDSAIRYHSASGGAVTSLLCHMLEKRIIDKALVVRMEAFAPHPFLVKERKEILSAAGSIYFKTFGLRFAQHIMESADRTAIVGLPCQLSALVRFYGRSERILLIGLVCNHVNEIWYLRHVLERFRPAGARPISISSRKNGWPGSIVISFKLDERIKDVAVPLAAFWEPIPLLHFSTPLGCLYCTDHLATSADIVAGDAWHPKFVGKDSIGTSIMIARTDRGLQLMKDLVSSGRIHAEKAELRDLITTYREHLDNVEHTAIRLSLYCHNFVCKKSDGLRGHVITGLLAILPLLCSIAASWDFVRRSFLSPSVLRMLEFLLQLRSALARKVG